MRPCLHFVGFRDDAYGRACRVFGKPDFVHRYWDKRAVDDVAPNDTIVFARSKDWQRHQNGNPAEMSFNDSDHF